MQISLSIRKAVLEEKMRQQSCQALGWRRLQKYNFSLFLRTSPRKLRIYAQDLNARPSGQIS
jgi:hypothetical protein